MIGGAHDISHAADVRMVQQGDNGRFASRPDLLGVLCPFSIRLALVLMAVIGDSSRDDLDGDLLETLSVQIDQNGVRERERERGRYGPVLLLPPCGRA